MQIKRNVAFQIRIKDILDSRYVKGDGDWSPNYLELGEDHVSRINLVGVVVSKNTGDNHNSLLLDDGSGRIAIRSFDHEKPLDADIGDFVLIIGRPREYGNQRYVVPEIIKQLENGKWLELRKLQLRGKFPKKIVANKVQEKEPAENPLDRIFQLIRNSDSGDGADFQDIIKKSNIKDSEKIVQNLLENGEIFEISPGKLKILE